MKKLIIATFLLFLSVPAMAGTWTNWFTVDSLIYDYSVTDPVHTLFFIVPDGTVENPESCTSSAKYILPNVSHANNTAGDVANRKDSSRLPTLAYTAGWQVRVHLNGCSFGSPLVTAIEIKRS